MWSARRDRRSCSCCWRSSLLVKGPGYRLGGRREKSWRSPTTLAAGPRGDAVAPARLRPAGSAGHAARPRPARRHLARAHRSGRRRLRAGQSLLPLRGHGQARRGTARLRARADVAALPRRGRRGAGEHGEVAGLLQGRPRRGRRPAPPVPLPGRRRGPLGTPAGAGLDVDQDPPHPGAAGHGAQPVLCGTGRQSLAAARHPAGYRRDVGRPEARAPAVRRGSWRGTARIAGCATSCTPPTAWTGSRPRPWWSGSGTSCSPSCSDWPTRCSRRWRSRRRRSRPIRRSRHGCGWTTASVACRGWPSTHTWSRVYTPGMLHTPGVSYGDSYAGQGFGGGQNAGGGLQRRPRWVQRRHGRRRRVQRRRRWRRRRWGWRRRVTAGRRARRRASRGSSPPVPALL